MPGRPPKPTNLLELTGAFRTDPQRLAKRAGEPRPKGPLGTPPKHWRVKPDAEGFDEAQDLCKIWKEVSKMAPWLTNSDRHTVEDICVLRRLARLGTIRPGERNVLRSLNNACGLDASGRAKLDISPAALAGEKKVDPRDAFVAAR